MKWAFKLCIVSFLCINFLPTQKALAASSQLAQSNTVSDQSFENLVSPFNDFIENAESVGTEAAQKGTEVSNRFRVSSFEDLWQALNEWFLNVAGISFSQIVTAILKLAAWFLNLIVDLIHWVLSLIP